MAITDLQAARDMAEQHPDLHRSRQIAFGENYLQDLEQDTGTSQYYSGFGVAPDWVTGAIGDPYQAPVVQEPTAGDAQVAEQIAVQDRDAGITGASIVQPTSDPFLASGAAGGARLPPMDQAGAVAAMTQPEAYNIPGTMPTTPVSGVWGPQEYLQQPETILQDSMTGDASIAEQIAEQDRASRVTLPSGDVFAADDPLLPEKMDYAPTAESQSAWQQVQSGLSNIGDFIKTHGQKAANFFMNAIKPGLGLMTQMLPQDTPIDKFNRKYQVGGDFYEDIVEDDPGLEGRLEGYYGTLQAGNISQDPFGKNTVSMFGDYPAMATETYNELIEKEKRKTAEGKELSQFDKDRKEYYGHVSGLTGKTNIPGTPLMVDTSPLKTFPSGDTDIDIRPVAKPIYEDEIKDPDTWLNEIIDAENAANKAAVIGVEGSPRILSQPEIYPEVQLDADLSDEYDELTFPTTDTTVTAQEAAIKAEIDRQNRVTEAEEAAKQRAIEAEAAAEEALRRQEKARVHISDRGSDKGTAPKGTSPDSWGPWVAKGGLIRKQYGKGGIVDLL